jgi:anti-sigma-K factor RskA
MTSPPDDILDLLTAYALGVIEPDEIARVSALLDAQPELRATLAELRATADLLPFGLPEASPPEGLRQRVLDHATGRSTASTSPPRRVVSHMRGWMLGLGGMAAIALLAAAIGWAQLFQAREQLAQLQTEIAQSQAKLAQSQADLAQSQADLAQIQARVADAEVIIASLVNNPENASSDSNSASIVRTRSGATVLIAQLPPLPPGRVYQIWRIQGNNSPTSAGLFRVSAQGYGTIDFSSGQQPQAGETVAVTNEPDGGSLGPTSLPLIVGTSNA